MKHIILHCLLSIVIFAFIFYSCAGVSGGDIAVGIFNIIFGAVQLLVTFVFLRKKKRLLSYTLLAILAMQVLEMVILVYIGEDINRWLKHLKYS